MHQTFKPAILQSAVPGQITGCGTSVWQNNLSDKLEKKSVKLRLEKNEFSPTINSVNPTNIKINQNYNWNYNCSENDVQEVDSVDESHTYLSFATEWLV